MEFIYAKELKKEFSVTGYFYNLVIKNVMFPCRSVLEIKSNSLDNSPNIKPCAVVVMMNPGSSKPENPDYVPATITVSQIKDSKWDKDLIPANPDNAQYQIMRLMKNRNWKYVRVLNLSDLRAGNSREFSNLFNKALKLDSTSPHSLVSTNRQCELKAHCAGVKNVTAAWGSNYVLKELAEEFLNLFPDIRGLPLDYPWYTYPSPYKKAQKLEWLKLMG
ncbi:hypothetical protein [Vibrio sp. 1CM7H]|uniref:hypothetical protein n=1 Tax=Vibrio sp. 1CM7H TaxID=2929168 RepID=UPI0020BE144E|nr:hypothetical protein [Vibrio sp. 1CM7H]MCK8064612.1 hypothetical protein [Vibrio sp. 1CM7H]